MMLLILSGDVSLNHVPNTSLLIGSLINIGSKRSKFVSYADFTNSNKSDVIAVTETWLRSDDTDSFISSVTPTGYKYTHVPCSEGRGSGVGFFIHDDNIDFRIHLNHVARPLTAYVFTCPWTHYIPHCVQATQCFQSQFHWGFQFFCWGFCFILL